MKDPTRRFSELSGARQTLVRLCQTINHGSIENLAFTHSEPIFDPRPVTMKHVKLDSDDKPRPEIALADFILSDEIIRLVKLLDELRCGILRHVEVRGGIPRSIVLES